MDSANELLLAQLIPNQPVCLQVVALHPHGVAQGEVGGAVGHFLQQGLALLCRQHGGYEVVCVFNRGNAGGDDVDARVQYVGPGDAHAGIEAEALAEDLLTRRVVPM